MTTTTLLLAAETGESPGLFAGSIWQSIAALLAFVILLVVLTKYAWGPILKGLQDREGKIKGDLEAAAGARTEADATLAEYKQQLADARKEAQQVVEQARAEANRLGDQLKSQTQDEINRMKDRATREIEAAKEQAVADVYEQAATISTQIAGQILGREISPQDQQNLVQQSLAKLQQQGGDRTHN